MKRIPIVPRADSIQIHGGVGLMREYSIERMLRDAKTIQNLQETNLVQKALTAKNHFFMKLKE